MHNRPWVLEWKTTSWSGNTMLLSSGDTALKLNASYPYRSKDIVAPGYCDCSKCHSYGTMLADHGISATDGHTYRMTNKINDGTNMIYLSVDGVELGAMNQYFVGAAPKDTTSNWLSGKDFTFPYLGTPRFPLSNVTINYLAVDEGELIHSHGDWTVTQAATCTAEGSGTRSCTICGEIQTEAIAATGHGYLSGSCTVCGAEAQTFFNYRTDALMNARLTDDQKASIETYRADMMAAVSIPDAAKTANFTRTADGFTRRYPSISFEGAFKVNYYCIPSAVPAGDITLYYWNQADYDAAEVLSADNATGAIAMTQNSDLYEAAITGIAAKDLDKGVYVAFVYSDGQADYCSGILGYSIGAYCVDQAAGSTSLSPFAKATAVYGYYAKEAFGG